MGFLKLLLQVFDTSHLKVQRSSQLCSLGQEVNGNMGFNKFTSLTS
jgi:hypothetical protein